MKTIENTINNVMTENTAEAVAQAVEAIPVKSINWRKAGIVGAVVLAIGAGAAAVAYCIKRKNEETELEVTASGIDNVKVAENDFVEKDSENK